MSTTRGALRITTAELPAVIGELNRILELLQQGGLVCWGIKFDSQRITVPSDVPAAGQPNIVLVNVAGVWTFYYWNGTTWTTLGAGVAGASTTDAFVTLGHPGDLTGERNLAVGAALSLVDGGANGDVTLDRAALTGDVTAGAGSNATVIAANAVTDAKLRQGGPDSVIGRSANSTGNVADISAGSDGDVLRRAGGVLGFGAIPESSVTNLVTDLSGKAATTEAYVTIGNTAGLSAERALAVTTPITLADGGANAAATVAFDQAVALGNNARVTVRTNSGTPDSGTRRRLNLIEGPHLTITATDDSTNEEVDITVSALWPDVPLVDREREFLLREQSVFAVSLL